MVKISRFLETSRLLHLLFVIVFALAIESCKPREDFIYGAPGEGMLNGTWILERIVTPSKTVVVGKSGSETLKFESVNGFKTDNIYHEDSLAESHTWTKTPWPVVKGSDKTIIVSYRDGSKRFHRIIVVVGEPTILEATQYVKELGSVADSIKYYYSQNWW